MVTALNNKRVDGVSVQVPVLLVEDDHISRLMMQKALEKNGYAVTTAENGYKALKIFMQKEFPIVVSDWIMPEMDGLDLCRAIRTTSTNSHVFIMILTTNDAKEDIALGLEAGADDYLVKPFHPVELFARLKAGRRMLDLQNSLWASNIKLKDQLQFIESLINRIPNPIYFKNKEGLYLGCNKACQEQLMGLTIEDIIGQNPANRRDIRLTDLVEIFDQYDEDLLKTPGFKTYETAVKCADGKKRDFLFNKATFDDTAGQVAGIMGILWDLTDKNEQIRKQLMNVNLARGLLNMINAGPPESVAVSEGLDLTIEALSVPCYAEGGDHYFIRRLNHPQKGARTVISLKDQSGHEVGCILRSIITDLLHHKILTQGRRMPLAESINRLNQDLCESGLLGGDDFVTAITAEIDHQTLLLHYVSAGHPPFLLIRGEQVIALPDPLENHNLPLGSLKEARYTMGEYQLLENDRMIFYTDGLIEMPLKHREKLFSLKDLQKTIGQMIKKEPHLEIGPIVQGLLKAVTRYSREQVKAAENGKGLQNTSGDDVTLLGIGLRAAQKPLRQTGPRPNRNKYKNRRKTTWNYH